MMQQNFQKLTKLKHNGAALKVVLLVVLLFTAIQHSTYADEPSNPARIRVALFLDLGTVYKVTTAVATLSAPSGLDIGLKAAGGAIMPWISTATADPVRFSFDRFAVQLLETSDFALAQSAYKKVSGGSEQPMLFASAKSGKTVYKLQTSGYITKADASKALSRLQADSGLKLILQPAQMRLIGTNRLEAGTYPQEAQAEQQAAVFSKAGLDVSVVIRENASGTVVYAVWIGQAAEVSELADLKLKAAVASPGVKLTTVADNQLYLLKRQDVGTAQSAQNQTLHYQLNANADQTRKIFVTGKQDSAIKVQERSARSYRGAIEISQLNQNLAVINELPLEQYLYAVVSTELSASWPIEALKAQAVAARSFALKRGTRYQIANVTDTINDQAYKGITAEFKSAIEAVTATAGETIVDAKGKLFEPLFYSNAGGITADPLEVWGNPADNLQSVASPDEVATAGLPEWFRLVLPDGTVGYIRSDLVQATGEMTDNGLAVYTTTADRVIYGSPILDTTNQVGTAAAGARLILIDKAIQNNDYSWIRGPYAADKLEAVIESKTKSNINGLTDLSVTERGVSGRAVTVSANGQVIDVSYGDSYRSALGGLPSTLFDIEQTGKFTVLGAGGQLLSFPDQGTAARLQLIGVSQNGQIVQQQPQSNNLFVTGSDGQLRVATQTVQFRFIGNGNGHGLGMSQWGIRGLANQGYDYQKILKYYYTNSQIVKG